MPSAANSATTPPDNIVTSPVSGSSWVTKRQYLLDQGVEERVASVVAGDFGYWDDSEIVELFSRVRRATKDFAYFRASEEELKACEDEARKAAITEGDEVKDNVAKPGVEVGSSDSVPEISQATGAPDKDKYISPPYELMQRSATEEKALCIDRNLEWSLKTRGYAALSHCWADGLCPDPGKSGLRLEKLKRLFKLLDARKVDAEWIWTDVLVIPGGDGAQTSVQDELLKVDIINTMKLIYERADCTIVLDALMLQLWQRSSQDVAAALMLGRWWSRIWTLQESLLSKRVIILTATKAFVLRDLVLEMKAAEKRSYDKFHRIWLNMAVMSEHGEPLTVPDIFTACRVRRATVEVDYARGLFGMMDLSWSYGMTLSHGMERLYAKKGLWETSAALFTFGAPRLKGFPRWAPAHAYDVTSHTVDPSTDVGWGMKASWWLNKVKSLLGMQMRETSAVFEFEMEQQGDTMRCVASANEDAEAIEKFKKAIENNKAYVISPRDLSERNKASHSTIVLLAQKMKPISLKPDDMELFVHLAVVKTSNSLHAGGQTTMVIRHNPPMTDQDDDDDLAVALQAAIKWNIGAQNYGDSPLYAAIKAGDVSFVRSLLHQGALRADYSKEHWAPMNFAAKEDQEEIVKLLLEHGLDIDSEQNSSYGQTPLQEACNDGRISTVRFLIKLGAKLGSTSDSRVPPLRAAAYNGHHEILKILLEHGADPNETGQFVLREACQCRSAVKRFECIKVLIDAGAEVNARQEDEYSASTAIQTVADRGTPAEARYLIEHGADPKIKDVHSRDALFWALYDRGPSAVPRTPTVEMTRLLLEAGCDFNAVYEQGPFCENRPNPAYLAVGTKNWEILRTLLEFGAGTCNVRGKLKDTHWTPLHLAVSSGQHTMVKLLLEHGAIPLDKLSSGHTAIHLVKPDDTRMKEILGIWLKEHVEDVRSYLIEQNARSAGTDQQAQNDQQPS